MATRSISQREVSTRLHVPATRINDIIRERRDITPDTALRLARYVGGGARSWMNLQVTYELTLAERDAAEKIAKEVNPRAA